MTEEFKERRKDSLSKNDLRDVVEEVFESRRIKIEEIKESISEALQDHLQADSHQFVKMLMAKEQRKQELWEKTKAHVVGWGSVALLTYFANIFWHDLISVFTNLTGHK